MQEFVSTFSNLQLPFLSSAAIVWHRFKSRLKFVSSLVSILIIINKPSPQRVPLPVERLDVITNAITLETVHKKPPCANIGD